MLLWFCGMPYPAMWPEDETEKMEQEMLAAYSKYTEPGIYDSVYFSQQ